ncbi:RNA-splicing ligase RtcB [Clostridium homopropionicum DSM 5847]|uniref:3'-phosphate/5'-hydroxy nucleic acid ligase n=2 Tax=Clostridium TaxID=1485 RepID=A0A0L6Z8B6_9CLOT|nr:RNA-splicing ligase RtcB [Clostridium homopropionicum DSM 5847]SFG17532.1 RNA-splicing ligase RtcB, repairs tRNA damage [Clostridium homopropionicum]
MELFDEVKNRYLHIIFKVLNECENGLSQKDIIKIIEEEEFQEKIIGSNFKTFEGLLLNQYKELENFNLLKLEDGLYFPNSKGNKKPVLPVRLTNIEKTWLKNMLEDKRVRILLKDATIAKLKAALKDFDAPNINDIIDNTNTSVLPGLANTEQYEENFRTLLKAIIEEKPIKYCNNDRLGNKYCDRHALPIRLEYSIKDGRFRVSLYSLDENRSIMANIFSMTDIEIKEDRKAEINRNEVIKLLHENRYSKDPIILEVTDKKAAMERCFMSFSELERYSRCIEKDKYEMKLFYYTFEEDEIIRKILALGPYVKVVSPQGIKEEIITRIRRALELNGCDILEEDGKKMIEIKGKHNTARVFTDKLEPEVISQVIELCNQEFCKDSNIAIMPDTHAGKGCVIGFTADLGDKVIPNIVGVDIGCGMTTIELGKLDINLDELDHVVRRNVPSGTSVHEGRQVKFPKLQELFCFRELSDTKRIERSIGTLGGGNHFIELDKDDEDNIYLVIHSGSRNLGKQVAEIYQKLAIDICSGKEDYYEQREKIISDYKKEGKRKLIQNALKELKAKYEGMLPNYPKELCFLTGTYREKYLNDMSICQEYAALNREAMASAILNKLLRKKLSDFDYFHTVHNYINFKDNIIRKGSISAYAGEKVLIPLNMRDGSIIAFGKGNADWNYSAPHGAGRLMSRSKAKENLTLEEFKKSMEGIYTTSVNYSTLDEAPMAYKPIEEILNNIQETVEILKIIKPIYNFKAGE